DGAAVHVDAVLRDAELLQHAERLRSEGFVQLPEVDLFLPDLAALERLHARRPRAHAHDRRVDAGRREAADAGERRELEGLRAAFRHAAPRRRAVVDARRVAGRPRAVLLLEGRLQAREPLRGGVGARVLVGVELDGLALLRRNLDRDDLGLELAGLL